MPALYPTQDGCTALMLAAADGYPFCIRLLLEAGANKGAKDAVRGVFHSMPNVETWQPHTMLQLMYCVLNSIEFISVFIGFDFESCNIAFGVYVFSECKFTLKFAIYVLF